VLTAAALAAACTPKETRPRVTYDGPVATALATLASDCVPIGVAAGQPLATATDLKCIGADAKLTIHLDQRRTLRSVQIELLAATTEAARARLETVLTPIIDAHHRTHALAHLDDPVPGGINPIPQLALEDHLYQIASEPAGELRRYIVRIRID
jgi:hypothetical protein